ncbi:MAG: hypothetical protein N2316_03530 [Spirochaetes bacterium]|nr:hypothetical protein [Spirochaetota bacterium]
MNTVKVILHCAGHCIETAARKELERLMGDYFEGKGDLPSLEAKISLLSDFLHSANFPSLRASDPRLSGEMDCTVALMRNENGRFTFEFREKVRTREGLRNCTIFF